MSYLAELTLRLAGGVSRLDEATRSRHASWLVAQQRDDGGFAGRDGPSDLYYTGFALRSLALCGVLDGSVAQRAAAYLQANLRRQVPIIDFLSLVYGAMLLEASAGIDVFAASAPGWREAVATELERFRRADGGYAKTDEGQSSSTYYTFLMLVCNELIGRAPIEPARLVEFVRSRQRADSGFVELGPMQTSGTNPTAAAIGALKLLGALDDATRQTTAEFLLDMQTDEGGLRANTRIAIADVLSTFTGLLTLGELDALRDVDLPAASRYVREVESTEGGFRGAAWDDAVDVEYTFYGLAALALIKNEQERQMHTDEHG
ncbi:MAG TPA: prenyltransferase/squalene oxidase repeat-containing protein [Pirellulales bacterium]|jgi:geranylgeranyl transferase type-2 subunit beta|nr:prenyltransferase/squalene oxidase repeat-containing protein [Pirellulales bacterium]